MNSEQLSGLSVFELTYDMGGPTVKEPFTEERDATTRAKSLWAFGLSNIKVKRLAGDSGYVVWSPPRELDA